MEEPVPEGAWIASVSSEKIVFCLSNNPLGDVQNIKEWTFENPAPDIITDKYVGWILYPIKPVWELKEIYGRNESTRNYKNLRR
jgi:hypothetical protein